MVEHLREQFNNAYSAEKHKQLQQKIDNELPGCLAFRLSESPIFVDKSFVHKVLSAVNSIVEQIQTPEITSIDPRIPANKQVPNETKQPNFLAIDFGICENKHREVEPQLIELQAFPSLFFYQYYAVKKFQEQYPFLKSLNFLFDGINEEAYFKTVKDVILGKESPENVVLMELFPEKQKTKIDFALAKQYLGIETICFTKIKKRGNQLYYDLDGKETHIKRIFNRLIFDDFDKYPDLESEFKVTDELDVEWITHPNWFYKISKIITPVLKHQYIPTAYFIDEFPEAEMENLNKYVLKPLFSYAGQGVIMNPKKKDLEKITSPKDFILQKKVKYASIFEDVNGDFAKAEFRVLCTWKDGDTKPVPLISLVRMTKSEMVNVDHNKKDQIWTGSSVAFFD